MVAWRVLTTLEGFKGETECEKPRRHEIFMADDAPTWVKNEASGGAKVMKAASR